LQSIADIAEVAIDVSLGVAIPGHEAAKFASKLREQAGQSACAYG
jgi:hypothetical protein